MLDHLQHARVETDQPQLDAVLAVPLFGFGQDLERSVLQVEYHLEIQCYDLGLLGLDQRLDLLRNTFRIREKHPPLRLQH